MPKIWSTTTMDAEIRRQIRLSVKSYENRPASDSAWRIAVLEENIARLEGRDGAALDRVAENKLELAGLKLISSSVSQLDELFADDETSDDGAA